MFTRPCPRCSRPIAHQRSDRRDKAALGKVPCRACSASKHHDQPGSKTCRKCSAVRPVADFAASGRATDGLQAVCRACSNSLSKSNYQQNKERYAQQARERIVELRAWCAALKAGPCTDCGVSYPPLVMEFDHLGGKEFGIAEMVRRHFSRERILAEVDKCELVCANCHRLRTIARQTPVGDF